MSNFIKKIKAKKIFNRYNFDINFKNGINIIYGKNGCGKTTLLHILANSLNSNFVAFENLDFSEVQILFNDGKILLITKKRNKVEVNILDKDEKKKLYPITKKEWINQINKINKIDRNTDIELRELIYELNKYNEELRFIKEYETLADQNNRVLHRKRLIEKRIHEKFNIDLSIRGQQEPLINTAYFPAFREMLEAWALIKGEVIERNEYRVQQSKSISSYAQRWFGPFTPPITYLSIQMIEEAIIKQLDAAQRKIWSKDNELVSSAFMDIFSALSKGQETEIEVDLILQDITEISGKFDQFPYGYRSSLTDEILKQVKKIKKDVADEKTTRRVLNVYKQVLLESYSTREKEFKNIQYYLDSVNYFFNPKKNIIALQDSQTNKNMVLVKYTDSDEYRKLKTLSSGERQIVTLIYSATHMSDQSVVLIDEPEISLHVDWQRILLKKMEEHIGNNKQIIASTHSPTIGAEFLDRMIELK